LLLIALAIAALLLLPPRILESEEFRQRVRAEAAARFGRGIEYREVSVSLDPPGLSFGRVLVAGASDQAPPLIEADLARISASPSALLRGELEAGSVAIERVGVRIAPSLQLVLLDLRGELVRGPAEGSIDFALEGALGQGGGMALTGRSTPDGGLEARIQLRAAELAPLAPLFPEVSELAGAASGTILFDGPVRAPRRFDLDLGIEGARLAVQKFVLRRHLQLGAELAGLLAEAGPRRGSFAIDATGARMKYGQFYKKPPGTPASVSGELLLRTDGSFDLGALHLEVGK
jgi:hypothetical protein